MDIDAMTAEIVATFKRYDATGTSHWGYEDAAQDLAYQVGSLTKLLMQKKGNRHAEGKTETDLLAGIENELTDIITDTLFVAHELGIDIKKGFRGMLEDDAQKVAARTPKA